MKAAVVYGENDIRFTDVPIPKPDAGEVLIKVKGSGVCATDVKILGGSGLPKNLPTILGHEVAGIIEEIGHDVKNLNVGQRVAVYPIAACGECFFCSQERFSLCIKPYGLAHGADGGFAEYLKVPAQIVNLGGIIDIGSLSFDLAAMIEPVSCCIAAAEQCGTKKNDHVVILGCGLLGMIHTIYSRSLGAQVIVIESNEERLQKARHFGADVLINPRKTDVFEEVKRITGVGADIVIAALGITKVVEQYLPLVRSGGVFNIFGGTPKGEKIMLDPRWLHYGEIILTGTFGASLSHFKKSFEFVKQNQRTIDELISVRCDLKDILTAVDHVKKGTALKSVIMFD